MYGATPERTSHVSSATGRNATVPTPSATPAATCDSPERAVSEVPQRVDDGGREGERERVERHAAAAYLSSRDSRRSLSTRPPVCSCGQ